MHTTHSTTATPTTGGIFEHETEVEPRAAFWNGIIAFLNYNGEQNYCETVLSLPDGNAQDSRVVERAGRLKMSLCLEVLQKINIVILLILKASQLAEVHCSSQTAQCNVIILLISLQSSIQILSFNRRPNMFI